MDRSKEKDGSGIPGASYRHKRRHRLSSKGLAGAAVLRDGHSSRFCAPDHGTSRESVRDNRARAGGCGGIAGRGARGSFRTARTKSLSKYLRMAIEDDEDSGGLGAEEASRLSWGAEEQYRVSTIEKEARRLGGPVLSTTLSYTSHLPLFHLHYPRLSPIPLLFYLENKFRRCSEGPPGRSYEEKVSVRCRLPPPDFSGAGTISLNFVNGAPFGAGTGDVRVPAGSGRGSRVVVIPDREFAGAGKETIGGSRFACERGPGLRRECRSNGSFSHPRVHEVGLREGARNKGERSIKSD